MKYALSASILATVILLTSCKPYQMDISQGKALSTQQVSQIKVGMTREDVIRYLGTPLQKTAVYDENRIDYIVTMQKNGGEIKENRLTIYFKKGLVTKIVQQDYVINKK